MLDPFSALSVASNVVQFVSFSTELLSKSCELYSSTTGSTAKHTKLETLYQDLHQLSQKLSSSSQSTSEEIECSPEEHALGRVADSCKETADELLSTIHGLKVTTGSRRKWRSFRQALKSVWKQQKIEALQKRLDAISGQFNLHFAAILRYV